MRSSYGLSLGRVSFLGTRMVLQRGRSRFGGCSRRFAISGGEPVHEDVAVKFRHFFPCEMPCGQQVHPAVGKPLLEELLVGRRDQWVITSTDDLDRCLDAGQLFCQLWQLGRVCADVAS